MSEARSSGPSREADILSLHVPLDGTTRNLIDAKALAAMKPGAVLINAARGGIVDEPALARALRAGRLGRRRPRRLRHRVP
jgi:(S)-sulfolactate dehydrogenase